jgi:uncharacterized membrane protein
MTTTGHLWALGYDDMKRAAQVREEIVSLGGKGCLIVLDTAVAVRHPDGSATLNGVAFVNARNICRNSVVGFLAGLALGAPPLSSAAVGTLVRATCKSADEIGIDEDFVCEVERLMKPGSSTLFVLDRVGDMDAILQGIRGLGGTVLKTTVDVERARLIQATLDSRD